MRGKETSLPAIVGGGGEDHRSGYAEEREGATRGETESSSLRPDSGAFLSPRKTAASLRGGGKSALQEETPFALEEDFI